MTDMEKNPNIPDPLDENVHRGEPLPNPGIDDAMAAGDEELDLSNLDESQTLADGTDGEQQADPFAELAAHLEDVERRERKEYDEAVESIRPKPSLQQPSADDVDQKTSEAYERLARQYGGAAELDAEAGIGGGVGDIADILPSTAGGRSDGGPGGDELAAKVDRILELVTTMVSTVDDIQRNRGVL